MTMLEVVNRLQEKGKIVRYRVRSDGGILITQINGKTYTGAKGNAVARELVGAKLSEARRVQLESIKPKFDARRGRALSPKERKLFQPDEDIKKQLKKVQRAWKKANIPESKGKITLKKLRWIIQNKGMNYARESLQQSLKYASGIAYDKNVDILLGYMSHLSDLEENPESLEDLIEEIDANRDKIMEADISTIYELLYSVNNGANINDVVQKIRAVLVI